EGSTTTLPSSRRPSFAISSLVVSSQTAKTTASASAIASSTEAARASSPSSCASAAAFASSLAARTTGSPPRTRCRASVPPMLPVPMIAVAMATPSLYLTPQLTSRTHPDIPLAKRAVDGDLVQSVLEVGERRLLPLREIDVGAGQGRRVGPQDRVPHPQSAAARQLMSHEPSEKTGDVGLRRYLHTQQPIGKVLAVASISKRFGKERHSR